MQFTLYRCKAIAMGNNQNSINGVDIEAGLQCAADGGLLKDIARALGCSVNFMNKLVLNNPVFGHEFKQARAQGWDMKAEGLQTIFEDNPLADVNEVKVKSDNLKWLLSKVKPQTYGDRITLTHELPDLTQAMTDARSRVAKVINPPLLEEQVIDPWS